ncbi:MAG: hypothetical protein AB8G14_13850 [Ilumatobacter sp.]
MFVSTAFVASNLYYFHRWTFSYSSSSTSPSYSDTPFVWKVGKYALLGAATFGAWVWFLWRVRPGRPAVWDWGRRGLWGLPVMFAALAALATLIAVPGSPEAREAVAWFFFLPAVMLLPAVPLTKLTLRAFLHAGLGLIAYHAVFVLVQIVSYLVVDRVPALSYAGGLLRFGGGLDDPNGFGIIIVLPILLTATMWRSFPRRWMPRTLIGLCAALLLAPSSFSALAGCVAGLAALALILRRPRLLVVLVLGVSLCALVLFQIPYVRRTVSAKSQSALGRFDFNGVEGQYGLGDHLSDLDPLTLLFGDPSSPIVSENAYVLGFVYFGVIGVGLVLTAIVISVRRGVLTAWRARQAGDLLIARLYEGLAAYLVAFAVASLGVPFFGVFPSNMLFWIVAALAASGPFIELAPRRGTSSAPREHSIEPTAGPLHG